MFNLFNAEWISSCLC